MTSVTLVAESATQMGVSMKLQGQEYWLTYLEDQLTKNEIDSVTKAKWEEKYDGYEMVWTFANPQVAAAENNIDAVCMKGTGSYAGGGFCCGLKYVNSFSSQPELWAIWAKDSEYKDFSAATGFSTAVDDKANWRTATTSFTVNWEVNRWLPKEERNLDYYVNEYRFIKDDKVDTHAYVFTSTALYSLKAGQTSLVLLGAQSGVALAAAALLASTALLSF